jgi:hypothetical protein
MAVLTATTRHSLTLAAGIAVAVFAVLAAGCGGSSSPGVASIAGGDSLPTTKRTWPALYRCYAAHGFPTYRPIGSPSVPSAPPIWGWYKARNGEWAMTPAFQKRFSGAKWDAANKACEPLFPGPRLTPAQIAARVAQARKVAQCMRSHDMPNLPDPDSYGLINLKTAGINYSSPKFQSAESACQSLMTLGEPFAVPVG